MRDSGRSRQDPVRQQLFRPLCGLPVAECVLDAADLGLLPRLEQEAAASGCAYLWVHSGPARPPDVYLGLGFEVAQATGGWERRVR